MEWIKKMFAATAMLSALTLGAGFAVGCEENDASDAIEDAADDAGDAMDDAVEGTEDALDDAGDSIEDATN